MNCWARAMAVSILIAAGGSPTLGRAAETRLHTCLSAGETREKLQSQKLIQPFRAMTQASSGGAGESIGIKLCRYNALMVYEVTVLRHDGRLVHTLIDASNGTLLPPHAGP